MSFSAFSQFSQISNSLSKRVAGLTAILAANNNGANITLSGIGISNYVRAHKNQVLGATAGYYATNLAVNIAEFEALRTDAQALLSLTSDLTYLADSAAVTTATATEKTNFNNLVNSYNTLLNSTIDINNKDPLRGSPANDVVISVAGEYQITFQGYDLTAETLDIETAVININTTGNATTAAGVLVAAKASINAAITRIDGFLSLLEVAEDYNSTTSAAMNDARDAALVPDAASVTTEIALLTSQLESANTASLALINFNNIKSQGIIALITAFNND